MASVKELFRKLGVLHVPEDCPLCGSLEDDGLARPVTLNANINQVANISAGGTK